ncbi:hypothetical protein PT2222_80150 [Paraburkholderia tropica]
MRVALLRLGEAHGHAVFEFVVAADDERACGVERAVHAVSVAVLDLDRDVDALRLVAGRDLIDVVAAIVLQHGRARHVPPDAGLRVDIGAHARAGQEGRARERHVGADVDELALRIDGRADQHDASLRLQTVERGRERTQHDAVARMQRERFGGFDAERDVRRVGVGRVVGDELRERGARLHLVARRGRELRDHAGDRRRHRILARGNAGGVLRGECLLRVVERLLRGGQLRLRGEAVAIERLRAREFAARERGRTLRLRPGDHGVRIGLHDEQRRTARDGLARLHEHARHAREIRQADRGGVRGGRGDGAVGDERLRDRAARHAHGLHGGGGRGRVGGGGGVIGVGGGEQRRADGERGHGAARAGGGTQRRAGEKSTVGHEDQRATVRVVGALPVCCAGAGACVGADEPDGSGIALPSSA